MKIDLLPELPPSGGYEKIFTAIDVFSRYAIPYTVSNPTAVNTVKVIKVTMTRHAYLRTFVLTDKGSFFVSQVIHEVAEGLGKKLKTCHKKTCVNHRGPGTGPHHNQDFFENGIRRIQETMAQMSCNPTSNTRGITTKKQMLHL